MRRRGFSACMFAALVLLTSSCSHETSDQRALKTFKQYVGDLLARYNGEKHERIERDPVCAVLSKIPHGYVKAVYRVGTEYGYDVRKTDSVAIPYIGVLEITWFQTYSRCQKTQENAQAESHFPYSDLVKYRYTYGLQEGKWVPQEREIQRLSLEDYQKHWKPCAADQRDSGEFGCMVPF